MSDAYLLVDGYSEQVLAVGLISGVAVAMGWGGGWFCVSYLWVSGSHVICIGVGDVMQR